MKKEKVLAVILAAAMTMGLAACGSGESAKTTTAQTTAAQTTAAQTTAASTTTTAAAKEEAAAETTTQAEPKEPDVIRILGVDRSGTDTDGRVVYLSDWVNGDSKMWQRLASDLLEKGIVLELDLIAEDQYNTVVQTQIAAGLDCDMLNLQGVDSKTRLNLVKQGILAPVNQIWENYSQESTKEFYTTGNGSVMLRDKMEDGNVYWLSPLTVGDYEGRVTGSVKGAMIRKDWLDKLNLPIPQTTDELYDALLAFQTQDVNGNGVADEVARAGLGSFNNGVAQFFGLGTDLVCFTDYDSGVLTSPWYMDGVKDYILFMKRLYDAGLLDLAESGNTAKVENRLSLFTSWWTETWEEPTVLTPEGAAPVNYVGISCDPGNGIEPVIPIQDGIQKNANYQVGFTTQANQEAVGRLLDYLTSDEYGLLTECGIEGYTYEVVDGEITKIRDSDISEVQIMSVLPALWTNNAILPRLEIADRKAGLDSLLEQGWTDKEAPNRDLFENYDSYALTRLSVSEELAVATEEETQRSSDIKADLDTYYSELLTKLIMGQQSMDDWDSYIADMKDLGLDELIEIYQARYDRTK